jgi:hypothetical protein
MALAKAKLESTRKPLQFSYKDLLELERAGLLDGKRVELIDGELIERSPTHPPHAIATMHFDDRLSRALGDKVLISVQNPLHLSRDLDDKHLPLPDVAVIERHS